MMTVQQVADELRVSAQCVYTLVDERLLQSVRLGRSRRMIRIRQEDFHDFLDDCRQPARRRRPSAPKPPSTASTFRFLNSSDMRKAWAKQGVDLDQLAGRNKRRKKR